MQMPETVKRDLQELQSRVEVIQRRHMEAARRECEPLYQAIQSIYSYCPQPLIVPHNFLKEKIESD